MATRHRVRYTGGVSIRWIIIPLVAASFACSSKQKSDPTSQPSVSTSTRATSASQPASQPVEVVEAVGPQACAATAECPDGTFCTAEKGDCNKPPGCKPGDMCAQVCYGVCASGTAKMRTLGSCKVDDDCELHASYCGECKCFAKPKSTEIPKCAEREVSCIRNPCDDLAVRCVEGQCKSSEEGEMK